MVVVFSALCSLSSPVCSTVVVRIRSLAFPYSPLPRSPYPAVCSLHILPDNEKSLTYVRRRRIIRMSDSCTVRYHGMGRWFDLEHTILFLEKPCAHGIAKDVTPIE